MKAIGLRSGLLSIAWILLIWLVFIPPVLGAEVNNLQAAIDEYMNATVKTGRFNGSILVAQKGEVMVKKGYGTANFEWQIPNSSETIFRLGSVTKQFCAACIMQLEEKGLLSLNDQLQKYIPDYPQGNIITIHHLLTHTSGIPNFTNFPDYISTMMIPSPPEKTIDRFKNLPLEFQPGEKFAYSNSNYVLLGFILEKVSGQSFENYLQENILKPLHMEHTGYDHPEKILPNRASGYDASSEGLINTPYIDTSMPHAAGAMYSTVEDMYLWDQGLYGDTILSKASRDKMFTPFLSNYGYGWIITKAFGRKVIAHDGSINGFATHISRFVDDQVTVIVLSNFSHAQSSLIAKDLSAIAFGEPYDIPVEKSYIELEAEILDKYTGKYEIQPGLFAEITRKDQFLFIQVQGQPIIQLLPQTETQFFIQEVDATLTFITNEKGEFTEAVLHQSGKDIPLSRVK